MEFSLSFAVNATGDVRGTLQSGDEPRPIEKGRFDAEAKVLTFEYESTSFGRLTGTATMGDDGMLKGDLKSGPDADGYAWEAKKKSDA